MRNWGLEMGSDLPKVSQLQAEQRPEPLNATRSSVQASGTHSLAAPQRPILLQGTVFSDGPQV